MYYHFYIYNTWPIHNNDVLVVRFLHLIIPVLVTLEGSQSQMGTTTLFPKPCLQVEQENEDPRSVQGIRVFGENTVQLRNI